MTEKIAVYKKDFSPHPSSQSVMTEHINDIVSDIILYTYSPSISDSLQHHLTQQGYSHQTVADEEALLRIIRKHETE